MDLDSIQLTKKRRRLILGSLFLLALGYLLTHTFEYSCVFTENQNSPTQGCISGPELKNYSVLLWSFSLIGYLIYESLQEVKIEIVDETGKG